MARLFPLLLACFATLTFLAPTSAAQAPKVGDWYEDSTDLGFKIKTPKGWEFIPSQPDERYVVGKYDPKTLKDIQLGRDWDSTLWLHTWIVKIDNRPEPESEEKEEGVRIVLGGGKSMKSIEDWLERNVGKLKKDKEKSTKVSKTPATEYEFVGQKGGEDYRVYVMTYELEPDLTISFVANGPGDHKKWKKYSTTYKRIGKSFKRVEVERVVASHEGLDTSSALRSQKRAKLQDEVSRTPGWELYETDNYFIISNNEDKEFIKELMKRLEAIRQQYEIYYPPEQAEKLRKKAAEAAAAKKDDEGDEEGGPTIDLDDILNRRTSSGKADPMELSKCSVVRVCKDRDQYHSYGGPGGSAGYWASFHEELVIYDDKAGGGRRDTWAVLNHEAFHQYIFYFYGSLAPHSWYNEGTGDFYSGFQLKGSKFRLKPFDWREGLIQENIKAGRYAPLKDIVRWTQGEYYGGNELGLGGGENYAQGWSMIYFFRTGPKKCRDWNPAWNGILDTYLETLAYTADLDASIDAAFSDVDWEELETAWKKYTLSL